MRHASISPSLCVLLVCLLACSLMGCDAGRERSSDDTSATSGGDGPTIVSLTPAITRMLIDMGKQDQLVGVSMEDDASLGLPVCGSYNSPVTARIVELKPDLVLTESPLGEMGDVPPLLRSLSDEGLFELKIIPHSRSIADVQRALIDAEAGLGAAVGDPEAAEHAGKLMSLRIELVGAVLKDAQRPRVLMLINPTTLGAIGTGVTHDELLRLAGGTNALAHVKTGYLTLDRAQLQQTVRPDVVLMLEPGGSELADNDPRLRAFEGLSIPVNTSRRFAVIQHPQAMLPSTALPEVMLELALVLHPDKAAVIHEAYDTAELIMQQASAGDEGGT
ncbi:MAG: ABC transporter substrate-binding protein [Phycisphaeraceae bacterium]|nr:ABC transporter substrate-binding protein [Phycisphaeraceae bacterium]